MTHEYGPRTRRPRSGGRIRPDPATDAAMASVFPPGAARHWRRCRHSENPRRATSFLSAPTPSLKASILTARFKPCETSAFGRGRPTSATLQPWEGGRLCLLVSIAVPARACRGRHIRALYRGIRDACGSGGIDLVGGDTSSSPGSIFLNLTIIGAIPSHRALTRSGARAGDRLYVTGTLGDARAGLHILQTRARRRQQSGLSVMEKFLTRRHLRPTPAARHRTGPGRARRGACRH